MIDKVSEKPVFGTDEWAKETMNCIKGCSHDCKYCYAKEISLRRHKSNTPDSWRNEELKVEKLKKKFRKRDGRIMFPSTHDITPENLDHCVTFLDNILKPGNEVLVVSKPHLACIQVMCEKFMPYSQQILFRFSIGSCDDHVLRFWEPHAPSFEERLQSLTYAFRAGFNTSVSGEPILENNADDLIRRFLPLVTETIWIGKPNKLLYRLRMNGHDDDETMTMAKKLMEDLSDNYITDLYNRYKDNPKIKWKESIKKVVGITVPVESGLDI